MDETNLSTILVDNDKMKQISALGVLIVTTLAMGCHSSHKTDNANFFTPAQDATELQAFSDRQVAAATAADPSLDAAHFTGGNLNSLGTAKLDALLSSCERSPLSDIYLTDGMDTPEHRQAITKYLACHGGKAGQFTFVAGSNPHSYVLASRSISDLDKINGASAAPADAGAGIGLGGGSAGK